MYARARSGLRCRAAVGAWWAASAEAVFNELSSPTRWRHAASGGRAPRLQGGAATMLSMKSYPNSPGLSPARGYSHVVSTSGGRTIYVAGQIAMDKDGNIVGKG